MKPEPEPIPESDVEDASSAYMLFFWSLLVCCLFKLYAGALLLGPLTGLFLVLWQMNNQGKR